MREIFMSRKSREKTQTKKVIFKSRYTALMTESVLHTLLFLNYYAGLFYDANLSYYAALALLFFVFYYSI